MCITCSHRTQVSFSDVHLHMQSMRLILYHIFTVSSQSILSGSAVEHVTLRQEYTCLMHSPRFLCNVSL